MFKHIPVLPAPTIDALNVDPDGLYIDCTLGGGGHSSLICENLAGGRLIGIDRDANAISAATERIKSRNFTAFRGNFHDFGDIMDELGITQGTVSGVLMDLGVSSHQIDTAERGFSFMHDGPLDMRMSQGNGLCARQIVNTYSEKQLTEIFFKYGEERHSRKIAKAICIKRADAPIETTLQLAGIIENAAPRGKKHAPHPAMRTFMAIRIAVNDELSPLGDVLRTIASYLKQGGRLAAITFHSLEDRIVKTTFNNLAQPCECPRDIPYCVCGKEPIVKIINRKPITAGSDEITQNSRSHSAKLRAMEKL